MVIRSYCSRFIIVVYLMSGLHSVDGRTFYVDQPGSQGYTNIASAVTAAQNGDEIIVADGIWNDIYMLDFKGRRITLRSEYGPDQCIIDLKGTGPGIYFHSNETSSSILDGFTIKNGFSGGGGAIYCEKSGPTIRNCVFINNGSFPNYLPGGGAIQNVSGSTPTIVSCRFEGNYSGYNGGAITNNLCNPIIRDCIFMNNRAGNGGAIGNAGASPQVINCLFAGNLSTSNGGAMYNTRNGDRSNPTVVHCTFSGNRSGLDDPAINLSNSDVTLINCILWNNEGTSGFSTSVWTTIKADYCCIQRPPDGLGQGNIGDNPLFVQPGHWEGDLWIHGDYHLKPSSPCIDAARNSSILIDLDGKNRPYDFPGVDHNGALPEYDMGVYESHFPIRTPLSLQILGPDEVGLKFIQPYTALVTFTDGSTEEVEGLSTWSISNPRFGEIKRGLLLTPYYMTGGNFEIIASYSLSQTTIIATKSINYIPFLNALYVNSILGSDSNNGQSPESPFATIQKGIDLADTVNCTVIVCPGEYYEAVDYKGKNITLTSLNPLDSWTVANTKIISNQQATVIASDGRLYGFDITGISSGVLIQGSSSLGYTYSPTIQYCRISSREGITINASYNHNGQGPLIANNIIYPLSSTSYPIGIYLFYYYHFNGGSQATIQNNTILGQNRTRGLGIQYRTQSGRPIVISNIITGLQYGIDITYDDYFEERKSLIRNNNIYNNTHNYWIDEYDSSFDLDSIQGNICIDALFMNSIQQDLHLQPSSPCIDAGDPVSEFGLEPEPDGGRINMGAYGNTPEATSKGGLILEGFDLMEKRRIDRTVYEYVYHAIIRNESTTAKRNFQLELINSPENVTIINPVVTFSVIEPSQSALSDDTFIIQVDRIEPVDPMMMSWVVHYIKGDVTGDGWVDLYDFSILSQGWLQSVPVYLLGTNNIVDIDDMVILSEYWLNTQ